ncbi:MAG: hypothetical protein H0T89_12545 [Deltaproteobacteria bacterium]|nr:hypothetical protein [Deltaproteobacteria bacterium]MDQ3295560.1 hypothetical protein [Myxococcota bacterium]
MKTAAIAALLVATTSVADADEITLVPTCVEIDEAGDQLPVGERPAARLLVVRALERADLLVVETGCVDTYSVSHARDGASVIVRMRTARGARKLTVPVRADMAATYARMLESLRREPTPPTPERAPSWDGSPEVADGPPSSRLADVDRFDEAPLPPFPRTDGAYDASSADPLTGNQGIWYGRVGFGSVAGMNGSSVAAGVRYGSPRRVVDVSLVVGGSEDAQTRGGVTAVKFQVLQFASPAAHHSPFYGGGLSLGHITRQDGDGSFHGTGPQAEVTVGYDLGRAANRTRYFFQADLSLPLFDIGPAMDQHYAPSFVASFGIGR